MPIANGVLSITPEDIKIKEHLWDAFGHYETEISAAWLIRFALERGKGWEPFTRSEIETFYNQDGFRNFGFNRLISGGFITEVKAGTVGVTEDTYHYTELFISRAYHSTIRP